MAKLYCFFDGVEWFLFGFDLHNLEVASFKNKIKCLKTGIILA